MRPPDACDLPVRRARRASAPRDERGCDGAFCPSYSCPKRLRCCGTAIACPDGAFTSSVAIKQHTPMRVRMHDLFVSRLAKCSIRSKESFSTPNGPRSDHADEYRSKRRTLSAFPGQSLHRPTFACSSKLTIMELKDAAEPPDRFSTRDTGSSDRTDNS